MTVKFKDYTTATATEKKYYRQVVERKLKFSLDNLDYIFTFFPQEDDPKEGATLTYVGDIERGRLSPSEHANNKAWAVASRICY